MPPERLEEPEAAVERMIASLPSICLLYLMAESWLLIVLTQSVETISPGTQTPLVSV